MKQTYSGNFEFFEPKTCVGVSGGYQVSLVAVLFVLMTYGYYLSIKATGRIDGYEPSVSLLFVPIYEEMIFRGLILKYLERTYGFWKAIVFSSVLFSIWHFKNIFWLEPSHLVNQMAYTGFFFGPLMAWITLKTRSVWPVVIVHYLNNMPFEFLVHLPL